MTILGCGPQGAEKRLEECGIGVKQLNLTETAFGCSVDFGESYSQRDIQQIQDCFAPFYVGPDSDGPGELLVTAADKASARTVLAESCTGGMAGSLITSVPGSSRIFWGSLVTYADDAKKRVLGVETVQEYGAVSKETVVAMARGALRISGVEAAGAVSGIAGPGGGTPEKPVGTVWFSFIYNDNLRSLRCRFSGDRKDVRNKAAAVALAAMANQINSPSLDIDWIAGYTWY